MSSSPEDKPQAANELPLRWVFLNPVSRTLDGMEGWMLRLASALQRRGDRCVIAARPLDEWRSECERRALVFEPMTFGSDFSLRSLKRLRRIVRAHGADILIAKGFKQARWARITCPDAAVGVKVPAAREVGDGWSDRLTLRWAIDRLFTDNERTGAELRTRYPAWAPKFCVVPNGVEDPGAWPDPARREVARQRVRELVGDAPFVVAWAGRLHPIKAPAVAIRAFAAARVPGALVMFGDGPLRAEVEALVRDNGWADRVVFVGWRPDARECFWGCDVLLLSSVSEGLPNTPLEAMAAGLPVIATDAGGTREVVIDGETGLLAPVGDVDALARHIRVLYEQPDLRARLGAAGAERVRRLHSVDLMAERVRAALVETLQRRRRSRQVRPLMPRLFSTVPHPHDRADPTGRGAMR